MVAFFVFKRTSLITWIKQVSDRITLPGTRDILRHVTARQNIISSLSTIEKMRIASAVFFSFAKVVRSTLLYEQLASVIPKRILMALVGFDVTADLLESLDAFEFNTML
jgi:hypothetical protein